MQIFQLFLWQCTWCRFFNYFCESVIDADFPIICVTVHLMQTFQIILGQCIFMWIFQLLWRNVFYVDITIIFVAEYLFADIPIIVGTVYFWRIFQIFWNSVFTIFMRIIQLFLLQYIFKHKSKISLFLKGKCSKPDNLSTL